MRMNMFELSKRKGSLCLVALLSLVLGACSSRQPSPALQPAPANCTSYPSRQTIQINGPSNKVTVTKTTCARFGGTVKFEANGTDACVSFPNGNPFTPPNRSFSVTASGSGVSLNIADSGTRKDYTFDVKSGSCSSGSDGGTTGDGGTPEREYSFVDQTQGTSGTLEVGTGGVGEEDP
jgi:hypothetical protein